MRSKAELTSPSRRRAYYAQLADAGLRVGKAQVAIQSSRLALSAPDTTAVSDAEATATLLAIEGAALVLTADRKDGARRLDDATASAPSGEIAALISAARSLETAIRAPPAKAADMPVAIDTNKISASSRAPTAPSASQTPVSGTPLREAVLTRGKTIFAMADKLVEQADR
ncbi:hypothetical protein [Pseudorhodoplanes sp.]|uniref:hypothetical protein n=1 Tax=Pseudorhodoplanes sp. TaxID=1934341 RepID=UPI003D0F08EA